MSCYSGQSLRPLKDTDMKNTIVALLCLFLVACGGGGGGGGTAPPVVSALKVTGTASEGALIANKTVRLKDANGVSAADTTTSALGTYSVDVTGLKAPFIVTVTGDNGVYVSIAPVAGTANVNPITTTVVALAAATSDVSLLFQNLTPTQISTILNAYPAKADAITTSLQAVLPPSVSATNYFTSTITAGSPMDSVFDTYLISVTPSSGIVVKTSNIGGVTVLNIPASTVASNSNQTLPVIAPNSAPLANAGTTQSVAVGSAVTLDGSSSIDADGDQLTYSWAIISKPTGSNTVLINEAGVKPTLIPDVAGTYVVHLIVNDGRLSSTDSTVTVTASVVNVTPVAIVGPNQAVSVGAIVTLDGSYSTDPNEHSLSYFWTVISKPSGSVSQLSSASVLQPTFTADAAGDYVFSLVVSNGIMSSRPATVNVLSTSDIGNISIGVTY